MARTARPTGPAKPTPRRRTTAAPPGKRTAAPKPAAAPKSAAPRRAATPAAPRLTRDELQALVTKLERDNERMRLRARTSTKSAKESAARIAELEDEVQRLSRRAAPAPQRAAPRRRRQIDPGDSVPPGAAVEEAETDPEAEAARESLEAHLHEDDD